MKKFLTILAFLLVYFLPAIIFKERYHSDEGMVMWLAFGWILALATASVVEQ